MENPAKQPPLEDLMVAMDVVDTLRHRQQLVDRELDTDARRLRLIEKLRAIYQAQGLEVTDQILADGVLALEQERFKYTPPESTLGTRFANLYVSRGQWAKPVFFSIVLALMAWVFFYLSAIRPAELARAALPDQLSQRYAEIIQIAGNDNIYEQALQLQSDGRFALNNNDFDEASSALSSLDAMLDELKQEYQLRVIQQPGESSGIWRIPDANSQAQNYYLIVEAVDSSGDILSLPITSEETGKVNEVSKWGIRVNSSVFEAVAADKSDDGIIQSRDVGRKQRGLLQPEYSIPTTGAAITDW